MKSIVRVCLTSLVCASIWHSGVIAQMLPEKPSEQSTVKKHSAGNVETKIPAEFRFTFSNPTGDGRVEPVDFRNDLIPLFTKNGCNAGACHGAAIGRGGFKLSLYGGDPAADYNSIVRELEGRRINLVRPTDSLIVLKPAEQLSHGGGNVFDLNDPSAQLLTDWIRQGATEVRIEI